MKVESIFDFLINLKKSVSEEVNKSFSLTPECTAVLYKSYANMYGDKIASQPVNHDAFFDFGRKDYSNIGNKEYFQALSEYIAEVESLNVAIIMKEEFVSILRMNMDCLFPILEYMDKKYDFGFMHWFNKSKYLFIYYYKDQFEDIRSTIDYNIYYKYSTDNIIVLKPKPYGPDDSATFVRANVINALKEYLNYYNNGNTIAIDKVILHFAGVIAKNVETN